MAETDDKINQTEAPNKKILVIEDDPSIMTSISFLLRQNRFRVLTANNWTQALDMLHEDNPDLILLDLVMPEIDGVKLLQFIREQGNIVPVIIVSASIDKAVREILNELTISAFVAKPFRINVLMREIWRALQPPLFLGEVKYEAGNPVILDEYGKEIVDPTRRRRRRRTKTENPLGRTLRRWQRKYPFAHPFVIFLIGSLCLFLAWLLSP